MCFVGWYIMVEIQWRKKRGAMLREGVGLEAHQTLLACLDNGWCNPGSTVQPLWLWPVTAALPPDQLPLAAQTFNLLAFSFKSYSASQTLCTSTVSWRENQGPFPTGSIVFYNYLTLWTVFSTQLWIRIHCDTVHTASTIQFGSLSTCNAPATGSCFD